MPFTPAHALAAVPFARGRFVFSALIVGTTVPDFSKIVTLSPATDFGHSWLGIFWFGIPVGLLSLWIFHAVLKQPLFALLPRSHQQRLAPLLNFSFGSATRFLWIVISIALGAFTHLAWDSFTHHYGVGVKLLPFLNWTLLEYRGAPLKIYKVLQHGSTVVGMAVLALLYVRWFKRAPVQPVVQNRFLEREKARIVLTFFGLAFLIAIIFGFVRSTEAFDIRWIRAFAGRSVVAAMALFGIQIFLFSVWFRLKHAASAVETSSS